MMTFSSASACGCFTLAEELGNVSPEACRLMGFHRSTYYELQAQGRPLGP